MAKGRPLKDFPEDFKNAIEREFPNTNKKIKMVVSSSLQEAYLRSFTRIGTGLSTAMQPKIGADSAGIVVSGALSAKHRYGKSKYTTNEYAEDGATIRPLYRRKNGKTYRPRIKAKYITINNILDLNFRQGIYGLPEDSEHLKTWKNKRFDQHITRVTLGDLGYFGYPEQIMEQYATHLADGTNSRVIDELYDEMIRNAIGG